MVRITKTMQTKHAESLPPYIKDFRTSACLISLPHLPKYLASFPTRWPFPKGDLYHWIPLLNRFDEILENFCKTYKLDEGPQTTDIACTLLESGPEGSEKTSQDDNLRELGFGQDGDRLLVESILNFSKMLIQTCGNRSIYASSNRLNSLLNTTDLSLLECTLSFGAVLAARYQAALKRQNIPGGRPLAANLLAVHYDIDLSRVLQLAQPFSKLVTTPPVESAQSATPVTPSAKGKEKAYSNHPPTTQKGSTTTVYANDFVSLVKGDSSIHSSPKSARSGSDHQSSPGHKQNWEEWGDVKVTYYPKVTPEASLASNTSQPTNTTSSLSPITPTPVRRSSNLGPHGQRANRQTSSEESPTLPRASTFPTVSVEDSPRPNFKVIEIPSSKLKSAGLHSILQENTEGLPQELQYELLTKLRVAEALTTSIAARRQILAIRILAITNLAYVHSETSFHEFILKQDSDEPRRLQLTYQLAELVHPPPEGEAPVPRPLQTLALNALDVLTGHQSRFQDICSALNTSVNHGVLLYVIRKAVAEMSANDSGDQVTEEDEWRRALFSLLSNLSVTPRTGGDLVAAGLIPILVEVLSLRSNVSERYHPTILQFLDVILYSTRDAFQTLVNAGGLDTVSELIVFEVDTATENVASGAGIASKYLSGAVDYEIPFFKQQSLKWLFKFIHHMMSTAGSISPNFDRLMRNLIDSAPLLKALRQIIANARCFGSIVWTNAVTILNDFINNEPTSFAVIAEAGLSKGLLESVTGTTITMPEEPKKEQPPAQEAAESSSRESAEPTSDDDDDSEDEDHELLGQDPTPPVDRPSLAMLQAPREGPLAHGIMPTSDTINVIPQAFGAICLNHAGMKMFLASRALECFFEIFESADHVKCMDSNKDLPANLGGTFDELVRHHPPLKTAIMAAVLNMVARVAHLCKTKAEEDKIGAKLWTTDATGNAVIADSRIAFSLVDRSAPGKGKAIDTGGDVEMQDADAVPEATIPPPTSPKISSTASMTPYVTAVGSFLSSVLTNPSVRSEFCAKGGIEYVLDLADSPCLSYDFADGNASRTLQTVISILAEAKPHLTIPSLLNRAQLAADTLKPFASHSGGVAFFAPFVNNDIQQSTSMELISKGTAFAKALVNLHSLVATIHQSFQNSAYHASHNHRNSSQIFTQLNVGDYYVRLVQSLGPLLSGSLKEDMLLQKVIPDYWKNATRVKDSGFGEPVADAVLGIEPPSPANEVADVEVPTAAAGLNPPSGESNATTSVASSSPPKKPKIPTKTEQESPAFKNYQTLRYLLSKMSRTISPFFQTLGKALVTRRGQESTFQKQYFSAIAEALADSILQQLTPYVDKNSSENYSYLIGMLHVLNDMVIEVSRHNERPVQTITIVLQAFKDRGGFDTLNQILTTFTTQILEYQRSLPENASDKVDKTSEKYLMFELATAGTKNILALYSQIVNGKNVAEATQTMSMQSRGDRGRTDHFNLGQFVVELRMAVLPHARKLWGSDIIEKGSSQVCEKLIEVIQNIAAADCEEGATKRAEKVITPTQVPRKTFKASSDSKATLVDQYGIDLATEALYRCNNNYPYALEYCREASEGDNRRFPIPEGDIALIPDTAAPSRPPTGASTGTATPEERIAPTRETVTSIIDALIDEHIPLGADAGEEQNPISHFDGLLSQFIAESSSAASKPASSAEVKAPTPAEESQRNRATVDDLNEERDSIRDNLIDRCLDVINAHGDVTFEVSDLITTVVNKSSEPSVQRKVVGETLVVALMSFAGEDDLRTCGKKIAAYAHLLALMLRDRLFYTAAVGELKENLSTLLAFVDVSHHSVDEPPPWIAHILLIIEMLLSEDERPQKTKWKPPKDENDVVEPPVLEMPDPSVPQDEQLQLLKAILDILPRINKDESLALAVLRILVILTRRRSIAVTMGEKKNIQRLFVMAKQLAGASSVRIQSPLMLILRHIIEDDDTVKQIMRAEIKSFLDPNRQQRSVDEKAYLRGLAHVALRNPALFVGVTNDMVKIGRWSYPSAEARHTIRLELKGDSSASSNAPPDDAVQPTVKATEDLSIQDVKTTTEGADSEMPDAPKPAAHEHKLPVLENPDGVIHFLLCELLNYRDVEDKDPAIIATNQTNGPVNGDAGMLGVSTPESASPDVVPKSTKSAKVDFKSEDHPIYLYRCFILQCLTELLQSYNRTKLEFINFKRSAPPQAMTPSKPRSNVVNYLLSDLIPLGTLDHPETPQLRKKQATSIWADSVLTALLSKTGEQSLDKTRDHYDSGDEPDLLFVRRFVLENILKAYKEASASTEPIDVKYARMLGLSDLMIHIMNGKDNVGMSDPSVASRSQKQLRRIMFEKGFVAALTASIADIDLNFPGAKRAVKYILRPLKTLTTTAVDLSHRSLISATPDENEEDEIESATSISEPDDDREETPDLFRNSTLGMFEPGREEDSSSESEDDDEEMYEGEYDEEMEYDDEEPQDHEEQISDEEEEIEGMEGMEGMGPIEGLSGDHGLEVEVVMDDDDDDDEDDIEGTSGEDDDDGEDDHDSEDDDARVEIIDEAGNIQQLAEEDDIGEWESDDEGDEGEEDDYEGQAADQEEEQIHAMEAMGGPLGSLVRALGGQEAAADMIERMEAEGIDPGEEDDRMTGEYGDEGDEEDEEDDDDMDEDEMLFDQYPMDGGPGGVSFGWDEVEPPVIVNRRPRGGFSPFTLFPGGPRDPLGGESDLFIIDQGGRIDATIDIMTSRPGGPRRRTNPLTVPDYRHSYRSYRSNAPPPRSADDGMNPLLQRNGPRGPTRDGSSRPSTMGSWIQAMGGPNSDILDIGIGGRPFGESPAASHLLEEIIRSLPPLPGTIARNGQALQFHITTGPGHPLPPDIQAMFGMRPSRYDGRRETVDPGGFFVPQSTAARWLEESKIIFGASGLERVNDLANAILALLIPPAIEADKAAKAAEEERLRKLKEEADKKAEEERKAKEAREAEEKIAREKKEAEEREAAERAAAEALAARGPEPKEAGDDENGATENALEAMEGVETEDSRAAVAQTDESAAADRPRITTIIRGSPFDITDLGIDPDFLAELPEEIREEVIMNSVAERRSAAAATGSQPSDIDQEFLAALPEDIREEIIQQERQDRRRREREERNRQAAAANGGVDAGEMDPASIFATMPAALREQVLMEQDEETLALLPQELVEQARAALRDHPSRAHIPGFARRVAPPLGQAREVDTQRSPRRAIVQMLDKSGVATLLRLMFIFQQGSLRSTLNNVLQNISLNRHNRNEVLSTLLHILQDGSTDMSAVERSFAHLSLRAKQPKDAQPKTPQPVKRSLTSVWTGTATPTNFEASPLMVVQQCLTTLVYLNQNNPHVPAFFLTEHESLGLKRNLSRKGKGKDNKAAKYALNSLLGLLDRDLIMESSTVMESLSTLLNMITSPLQALSRKQKEIEEAPKAEETTSGTNTGPSVASPEVAATTSNEQPSEPQAVASPTEVPAAGADTVVNPEGGDSSEPQVSKPEEAAKEIGKKQRPMNPPVIPEHNLKLVINIFVARECSSKTFRETLSTIKNLSAIPGAKAIFGRELILKAQAMGEIILVDLEELLPQIQKATTGTEIQGVALAKFSPGSSDQNKLLRVLTALDHLFDPKRERKDNNEVDAEGESSQLVEKQDLLSSLYQNPTFGRMWERLSTCLGAIRQRENLLNVATILLPLIESLMVVCKNTTVKDAPLVRPSKELLLTSPPPESRMESLFFTFTEEHRKILNDLVRNSPKLMSGTFSLLVKNPKVLEFDNKRNYFNRSIHSKAPNGRQSFPPLQLSVRRDQVFHDSFKSLYFQTGDQMKYGKLSIRFHGEEGVDAGGVTREWFQVLSRQMFDPGYALFIPVSSDRTTFHPNQLSSVNEEHLMFFKFIGRIIGKALYEGRVLDCHFSRAVYKRILGKAVSVKDMESLDPDYYKSLVWMLENDITDIITETFSVDNDKFGVVETIDFIPNGRNIAVTEENKQEYVRLMVEWKLTGSVKEQLDEFLKGFHDIISADLISIFNEQELELLISGLPEIDVDDWKSNTEYHQYTASSPQIQWFWRAVRSFDKEERAKLLQFVTGTSKVPLNGFKELEGMNGFSRFNIHRDYGDKDRLPSSHTCFNQLDLPEYESYESLRQQVHTAITVGSEYFGFA